MMNSLTVVAICLVANTLAFPVVENDYGDVFALVPLTRVRRAEVYANLDITEPGKAIAGVRGTPIDNDEHRLDTNVFASTNIAHHSPISKGAEASYLHKPTNSNLDLSAINTPQLGTDLKASGKYNFFQDKTTNANVEGFYSTHRGGRPGSQRPDDFGIQLNFKKDF